MERRGNVRGSVFNLAGFRGPTLRPVHHEQVRLDTQDMTSRLKIIAMVDWCTCAGMWSVGVSGVSPYNLLSQVWSKIYYKELMSFLKLLVLHVSSAISPQKEKYVAWGHGYFSCLI